MYKWIKTTTIFLTVITLLAACSTNQQTIDSVAPTESIKQAENGDPFESTTQTDTQQVDAENAPVVAQNSNEETEPSEESILMSGSSQFLLPERSGPRQQTSGTVPHVQIGIEPVAAVNNELIRRAFTLPGVEDRPTVVSLPGARGMWLTDKIAVAQPEAIPSGREFAHIHPDGSLHAPLPLDRALEVAEKGWGERHPWATEVQGWDGLVMLYTPLSMEELDITFELIVESYNHVTGQTVQASDFE